MDVEHEIRLIHERNRAVEANKAWEQSFFRRVLILVFTYAVAFLFLWVAHIEQPWLGACVPAAGYTLSTLSLPSVKRWWMKTFYR